MKKIFLFGIVVLILISLFVKANELQLGYVQDDVNQIGVDSGGHIRSDFQYFRFNRSVVITGIRCYMMTGGNTPENLTIMLTDSYAVGYYYTKNSYSRTGITANQWNYFDIDNYTIQANRDYGFYLLSNTSATNNYYAIGWDAGNVYTDGGLTDSDGSPSSWTNRNATFDLMMNITFEEISAGAGVQPSITLLSDLKNGTITNSTSFKFFFNGTSVNNSNTYSCNIYENTTLKNSSANIDLSVQQNLSFTLLGTYERWINFTLDCYNENASSNLSALYYVDNVKSVLDYAEPNGTYYNDVPLYTNFSVSDTNLYSIEWLVYQGTTLKENISHKNIVGGTYAVYNLSAVSQITGNYNWILNVWENHNPLTSPDLFSEYKPTQNKTSGEITYSLNEKSYTIQSKELLDITTETKYLKQYFTFTPDLKIEQPKFYTYYLKSPHFIDYIKESQYKGHFVIWDIKRYVDFQCNDYVNVFKESDFLYRIETPCTKFETTGNLNFQQFTGNFTITTPPSLSDEYLLSINETITYYGNEINLSITNIYEVLEMLGFILINALYLVIINYVIQPIDKRLYFIGIVPLINLILISFKTIELDIFTEYLFNTFVIISSIAFFVSIIILYTIGLFKPITEKSKDNKKDFYGYFK